MIRTYGNKPFRAAVIHGGPGAMGSIACIARELSKSIGIVEPIQSRYSIPELIDELHKQIKSVVHEPLALIGHSWGAWLAALFAAKYPEWARRLVLVGCPPFDEKCVSQILERRLTRLSMDDAAQFQQLLSKLDDKDESEKNDTMNRLERLVEKSDNVDIFRIETDQTDLFPADGKMYSAVWAEAAAMRKNGELVEILKKIACPVTVIHGDCDPHPVEGVIEPLKETNVSFEQYILPHCGHSPFKELQAYRKFYDLLRPIVQFEPE